MFDLLVVLAALLVAAVYFAEIPRGRKSESGQLSWGGLLPAGTVGSVLLGFQEPGIEGQQAPAETANGSTPWWAQGRYVDVGRKALEVYERWKGRPQHPGFDITAEGETDDQELAKIVAKYRAIPAHSDLGQLAVEAGAKVKTIRVKLSDGRSVSVQVIPFGASKARARRKSITPFRLGTAAWVMRRLKAQQRLGRRLASVASSLYPKPRSCAPAKRR